MDSDSITNIVTLVICLILSAFFSASETSFSTMNRIRVRNLADKGNKTANLVLDLYENYDKLLSTILIGNNIVNIMAASVGTVLFVRHFGDIGATISTIVITVTVLIFGEITPKNLAKEYPESFAFFAAPVLNFLKFIFTPLNFLFSGWRKLLTKMFKNKSQQSITEDELLMLVEEANSEGAINDDDKELINNAIDFNDLKASDILTPRVDIVSVDKTDDVNEIMQTFADTGFSRILVYEENDDDIIGIITLKNFVNLILNKKDTIESIVKPVLFVSPHIRISELLRLLQRTKNQIAVVTDEYGGTMGIVTMEDILEELVGDIWDEHDEIVEEFRLLDDNVYLVKGGTDVDKLFELIGFDDEDDDATSTTVSGWIIEKMNKIPEAGDMFDYENFSFTIQQADNKKVIECVVKIHDIKNIDEK